MPRPAPDVSPETTKRDLTEAQLQAHLTAPALAVDTETMGLNLLRDRLCVVQLCDSAGRASLVQVNTRLDRRLAAHKASLMPLRVMERPADLKTVKR